MKKVYRVLVSKEVWIFADSDRDAEYEAKFCADDDLATWNAFAIEVKSANAVPDKIKETTIWGSEDEITVVEAFEKVSPNNALDRKNS